MKTDRESVEAHCRYMRSDADIDLVRDLLAEKEVAERQILRVKQMLNSYGVHDERMSGHITKGLDVLVTRMDREIDSLRQDKATAEAARDASQTCVDVQQIIYALERSYRRLDQLASDMHKDGDRSAEFPAADAERMKEAIAILEKIK